MKATGTHGRRERILEAAGKIFRTQGYDASMDDIAAEAHVAKQTLYNQFGCKEELFRALIAERSRALRAPLMDAAHSAEPRAVLMGLAREYHALGLSPKGIDFMRMLISLAGRFPEMARDFYDIGPAKTLGALVEWIDGEVRLGRLRVTDSKLAAEHYLSMILGHIQLRGLLNIARAIPDREIERRAAYCADAFLKVHGCANGSNAPTRGQKNAARGRLTHA
ncbi:MAG: TetR family transcriptional regulator [Alphaproteobacteria bacterium]|nr:TetR family transcriptional regulator [Alphaproteobacteria bacterium]